jgi:hypothetical protein
MRRSDPPGYIAPYRLKHHPVTSLLTVEEYSRFATLAIRRGRKPSQLATETIRALIAKELETQ